MSSSKPALFAFIRQQVTRLADMLDDLAVLVKITAIRLNLPVGSEAHLNMHGSDRTITFTIRDQGMGIPQNDIPHFFAPFRRGANAGTTRGTGVGLASVHDCVEAHGGHITVRIPRQLPVPDHV